MSSVTTFMGNLRRIGKLYERMCKPICSRYQLTSIEATIISFLCNNPGKDTAADIVEFRMLSKSNVSNAVESLIQKKLILRKPDEMDRRKIHLSLTAEAKPIVQEIESIFLEFREIIFRGFSQEEQEMFFSFNNRIVENVKMEKES